MLAIKFALAGIAALAILGGGALAVLADIDDIDLPLWKGHRRGGCMGEGQRERAHCRDLDDEEHPCQGYGEEGGEYPEYCPRRDQDVTDTSDLA